MIKSVSVRDFSMNASAVVQWLSAEVDGPESIEAAEVVHVREADLVNISCSAKGNPDPKITWSRFYPSYNRTSGILSEGSGIARLVLKSARKTDTALYLCEASNEVNAPPPMATKLIVLQPATEFQEVMSGISSWAAVGSSGHLPCQVRAAPKPTIMWTTSDGMQLQSGEKYTLQEPKLVDQLVLWSSALEVHHVGREDYGPYTCTADNGIGRVTITRTLNPPSRPHPPTHFSIINVTSTSVTLSWTPNFGGGRPQGYTLRYRAVEKTQYQVVDISGGETAGTTLTNLQPNTAYIFTIQAKNDQGLSAYVSPPITATMHGESLMT
ncbi:hypothetical protein SK128_015564 [Halocaridina rubra]|uniref:Uncharacterized protein n=1 Tax=Halocaridina rubra TaxID=373956 RepID=A0AAN9A2I3_HALRR